MKKIFFPKTFEDRYIHVGWSHPTVPEPWVMWVKDAIHLMEQEMWPGWMPMWLKRAIHYLATGNSYYKIKYRWANNLRNIVTDGSMIQQIKTKFGRLCIYYSGNSYMDAVSEWATDICSQTCEKCGTVSNNVEICTKNSWVQNLCDRCSVKGGRLD